MIHELTGQLLLAPPTVVNEFWKKSVVLVTSDTAQGSFGLILNKRSKVSLKEFGKQVGVPLPLPGFVYIGGPVNTTTVGLLHTADWSCSNTLEVTPEIYLSSDNTMLQRLSMGDFPERWRLIIGMCEWAPFQLQDEVAGTPPRDHNFSWCIVSGTAPLVFEYYNVNQWDKAIESSASEFAQAFFT
jgi:putative transcriptional regulator